MTPTTIIESWLSSLKKFGECLIWNNNNKKHLATCKSLVMFQAKDKRTRVPSGKHCFKSILIFLFVFQNKREKFNTIIKYHMCERQRSGQQGCPEQEKNRILPLTNCHWPHIQPQNSTLVTCVYLSYIHVPYYKPGEFTYSRDVLIIFIRYCMAFLI